MRAVDESMRHSPAVCGTPRTVTENVDFEGFRFPAGTFMFVNTFTANRDPEFTTTPIVSISSATDAPAILTFGGGVHYCLGANLARLEFAEALRILASRIPEPHRVGDAPWKPMLGMTGPTSLLVEFDA